MHVHGCRAQTLEERDARVVPTAPSVADVLQSLQSGCQSGKLTFDDFCSEFNCDSDSRKAKAMWRASQGVRAHMCKLLGTDFEAFLQLQEE